MNGWERKLLQSEYVGCDEWLRETGKSMARRTISIRKFNINRTDSLGQWEGLEIDSASSAAVWRDGTLVFDSIQAEAVGETFCP